MFPLEQEMESDASVLHPAGACLQCQIEEIIPDVNLTVMDSIINTFSVIICALIGVHFM